MFIGKISTRRFAAETWFLLLLVMPLSSFALYVHAGILEVLEHCLRDLVRIGLRRLVGCCQGYRPGIRVIESYKPLANLRLDEVASEKAADFAAWRLSSGLQVSSVNSSLQVLRRVMRLAGEWGVIEVAPKINMGDAWTLARIAGHSSVAMSARYVHPSEDAVLSALDRLSGHNFGHSGNSEVKEATDKPLLSASNH